MHHQTSLEKEHRVKNEMVYQQAFILALLNQYCGFEIESPLKLSVITASMPRVTKLVFEQEFLLIDELSEKQSLLLLNTDRIGMTKQKAVLRQFRKNAINFTQNLLIDVCIEMGYFFQSLYSKKTKKTFQVERIQNVYLNNKLLFTRDDLLKIGMNVNTFLMQSVEDKSLSFNKNNETLLRFLNQF
ncbi:Uncharacterized protein QTN25_004988 [Entamoeba marina]